MTAIIILSILLIACLVATVCGFRMWQEVKDKSGTGYIGEAIISAILFWGGGFMSMVFITIITILICK